MSNLLVVKLNSYVWELVSDGQRSCIILCATCLPPWFAIRNENFIAFPDPLRRAPDTHPKFTGIHPIVPEESIGPLWDSSVVVDKSRLITRFVSINPQAWTVREAVQTEIVVGRRAIITMYFTWMDSSVRASISLARVQPTSVIKDTCIWFDMRGCKQSALAICRVSWIDNMSNCNADWIRNRKLASDRGVTLHKVTKRWCYRFIKLARLKVMDIVGPARW